MPTYEITSPTGEVYEVTAPDGASEAEILSYAQNQFSQPPKPSFMSSVANTLGDTWEGVKNGVFGFGDEIQAGLSAAVNAPEYAKAADIPYPDALKTVYNDSLSGLRQEQQTAQENSPLAYLGGNIAGTLATGAGLANAATAIAPRLSNAVSGYASSRPIATGATVGASQGGVAGFGNGESDIASRAENAANNAILGGAVGGLAGGVVSGISGRLASKGSKRLTAADVRQQASEAYKRADQVGGALKPQFTDKFIDNLQFLRPQTAEGKIVGGENAATSVLNRFEGLRGKPITLQGANEIDKILGDEIDNFVDPLTGKVTEIGKKLLDVQSTLRNQIDSATQADIVGTREGFEALKDGRKLWSKAARLNDIERILQKADSADNKATVIKNGFASLANNPKRLRGYNDTEKAAIKAAAKTGLATDILKVLGSRLGPIGAGVVGTAGAGPIGGLAAGALTYGTSAAARRAAEAIQAGKAANVADLIANGAPIIRYTDPAIVAGTVAPAVNLTVRPSDRR